MKLRLVLLLLLFGSIVNAQENKTNENSSEVQNTVKNEFFKDLNQGNKNPDGTKKQDGENEDGTKELQYDEFGNPIIDGEGNESLLDSVNMISPIDSDSISVYGMKFINNQLMSYTNENSLVPPPNYRIGPGDVIAINLWDGPQEQQTYTVDKDGSIFPAFLGKVYVQGLTFENLQSLLKSRFYTIVPAGSKVDVQLVKVRQVRVNVVGEVQKPNSYAVSSFGTVINVLAKAGGLTDLGSLRNIEVKRNGYTVYTLDIYDFMSTGGYANEDFYLENNDYIIVPVHKKTVQAAGLFVRPMYYQLKDDENLQKLIELSGGVRPDARRSGVQISRYGNESREQISIDLNMYLDDPYVDYVLADRDLITVEPFQGELGNIVTISGAVNYPNKYELISGERLIDILDKAGGLRKDAYLKRVVIKRGDSTELANTINLDLSGVEDSTDYFVVLELGDKINIFSNYDFYTPKQMTILGEVNLPGVYPYEGKISVKDLILKAGGLTEQASYDQIEISRVYDTIGTMNFIKTKPNRIYYLNIYPDLESDMATENFILQPYDVVMIKKTDKFKLQEVVQITGEVMSPGFYSLDSAGTRISELIKRAGGVTKFGVLENASLFRDTLGKFYCDFEGAMKSPGSLYDVKLVNGDSINVPNDRYFVTIQGAVLEPLSTFVNPDFTNLSDYIQLTGGFDDKADTKRLYIKYNDGRSVKPKTFLFYKFYPSLDKGCLVVVPYKNEDEFGAALTQAANTAWERTSKLLTTLNSIANTTVSSIMLYLSVLNRTN